VTGSADLFSLGVVLYELVSGELPIGAFRPLSKRAHGIPPALDAVVSRLLAYEPAGRFADAAGAAAALQDVLQEMLVPPAGRAAAPRETGRGAFLDWLVERLTAEGEEGGGGGRGEGT
jgi:serine/threonine-protein kinase